MVSIEINQLSLSDKSKWLQHAVAPRPIALVSTIDREGNPNLSPFSFFNIFSIDPPVLIFSPARGGRSNTTKHTLQNILAVPEAVIHICDYEMAQQVHLSGSEYPRGVDEFLKSGFTKQPATRVKPPMVQEAKIKLECRIAEIKSLGENAGAGQLVIAEILIMHVADTILNETRKMIDPRKIQYLARLGGNDYSRTDESNVFEINHSSKIPGIGFDRLPDSILQSKILTANQLGQLASVSELPVIETNFEDELLTNIIRYYAINPTEMEEELHRYAGTLLDRGEVHQAWQVLLTVT